jgi:hypothetical protein
MSTIIERVTEMKQAVVDAKARVEELDEARKHGARRVEQARALLMEHYQREGRGEPDVTPEQEAELVAALREAEGGLTIRTVEVAKRGEPEMVLVPVDEPAEARYAGAKEALELREADLREFVSVNLAGIEGELTPLAVSVRAQVGGILDEARHVAAAWERFRAQQVEYLTLAGRSDLADEVPDNPLRFVQDAPRNAPLPIPKSLTEDDAKAGQS